MCQYPDSLCNLTLAWPSLPVRPTGSTGVAVARPKTHAVNLHSRAHRLRWLRRNFRWLAGTLLLLLLPCMVAGADDAQIQAVKRIQKFGGKVTREKIIFGEYEIETVTAVDFSYNDQITDSNLKDVALLDNVRVLNLNCSPVTDKGLEHLTALKYLQTLRLGCEKVTDTGFLELGALGALTHLQRLSLDGTSVTDAGLKGLGGLTRLQELTLGNTGVTDRGFKRTGWSEVTGVFGLAGHKSDRQRP